MHSKFDKTQVASLKQRTMELQECLPDSWWLDLSRVSGHTAVFTFDFPGVPEVGAKDKYLNMHYVMASSVPGQVICESIEEADRFLDLVEQQDNKPIEYEKVLQFGGMVHYHGWVDAIYAFVEDTDELPAEADGAPYWVELPEFDGAELITTVGSSSVHGSHHDIVQPDDETALLIEIVADVGGEREVELAQELEAVGIEEDTLEEFLALQLVCHDERYGYVRYDLMGAIWLASVPENEEFLEAAIERRDFLDYYKEEDGNYANGTYEKYSPREEAIKNWMIEEWRRK